MFTKSYTYRLFYMSPSEFNAFVIERKKWLERVGLFETLDIWYYKT